MTKRSLGFTGALAGIIAALVYVLVALALRVGAGILPISEAFPDRIAPLIPVDTFLDLLVRLGGYNSAKQFGVGSFLAGQLLLGASLGLLYANRIYHGTRHRAIVILIIALVVIWSATLVLLQPVLAVNVRGLPPSAATIVTIAGSFAAFAAFGVTLVAVFHWLTASSAASNGPARRAIVTASGAAVLLAIASGGILKRLSDLAVFAYDGMQFRNPELLPITPNDAFYAVTKNVVDPMVDRSLWRLEITGLVNRPMTYDFADVVAMPAVMQETTLMCISNRVGDGLMSNAVWKGVPLPGLLQASGVRTGAVEVVVHGVDGYTDTFPIETATDPATIVAYEMNGEPMADRHGYPVRLIVPGFFGEKNVKWLTRIEVVDHDVKGFYEQQGWGPNFIIPTRSQFEGPDLGKPIPAGTPVVLKGSAFAGNRGISTVEVSTDDGGSWRAATIDYPGSKLGWALWSFRWQPAAGEYRLVVRATDGTGMRQTSDERGTAPQGATGYHKVTARVQ